jgi:hypothetical protein
MKWVKGTKSGAFIPVFQAGSVAFSPIRVTTGYVGARVEVLFGDRQPPPFADEAERGAADWRSGMGGRRGNAKPRWNDGVGDGMMRAVFNVAAIP